MPSQKKTKYRPLPNHSFLICCGCCSKRKNYPGIFGLFPTTEYNLQKILNLLCHCYLVTVENRLFNFLLFFPCLVWFPLGKVDQTVIGGTTRDFTYRSTTDINWRRYRNQSPSKKDIRWVNNQKTEWEAMEIKVLTDAIQNI